MPRTIVIVGGGRNVGKTFLAQKLGRLLPRSTVIKIGLHHARQDRNSNFFALETPYSVIESSFPDAELLIIESGSILDDPDLIPDLAIFLPSLDPAGDKPGSERRRQQAHLVRGETFDPSDVERIRTRLAVDDQTMSGILKAVRGQRQS